jgi:C4-dicarboxylate-specific signal transduction histidine kinase
LYGQLAAQADGRRLIDFDTERGVERALVAVSMLTLHGAPQRLAALMPVEIMNSLTPIASLSRTAHDLVAECQASLPADVGADLTTALDAINRRADSLVTFVASYRSLSNVPPAQPERVRIEDLFARVAALVAPAWRARGGTLVFSALPASLELMADPGQLEQALINLLKNAFEATASNGGSAWVEAHLVRGSRLHITVRDDGPGVPDALVAHIFTPFFTTKKQGGGIGLAMVRHLIHENGGAVRYAKSVGPGARFVISF